MRDLLAHFREGGVVRAFLVVQKSKHLPNPLALKLLKNIVEVFGHVLPISKFREGPRVAVTELVFRRTTQDRFDLVRPTDKTAWGKLREW